MENSVSAARSTCHAKDRSVHPLETKNIRAYSNKTAPLHFPCRLFISHLSSYSVALFLVLQRVPMFLSCIILGGHFFFSPKKMVPKKLWAFNGSPHGLALQISEIQPGRAG